jgi:hypothetical protein
MDVRSVFSSSAVTANPLFNQESADTTAKPILRQYLAAENDETLFFPTYPAVTYRAGPPIFCARLGAEDSSNNKQVAGIPDHINQ